MVTQADTLAALQDTLATYRAELADHGPVYTETNMAHFIKEPWNMVSAGLFVFIVGYWLYRVHPNYSRFWLISLSAPVLMVGAVGGMIYHGFRSSAIWYYLDYGPILGLVLITSIYFWLMVLQKRWYVLLILVPFFLVWWFLKSYVYEELMERHIANNLEYTLLGLLLMVPILINIFKTRARHLVWFIGSTSAFALALLFRTLDARHPPLLPMGTHFLWHTFGTISVHYLFAYCFHYERSRLSLSIRVGMKRHLHGIRVRLRPRKAVPEKGFTE